MINVVMDVGIVSAPSCPRASGFERRAGWSGIDGRHYRAERLVPRSTRQDISQALGRPSQPGTDRAEVLRPPSTRALDRRPSALYVTPQLFGSLLPSNANNAPTSASTLPVSTNFFTSVPPLTNPQLSRTPVSRWRSRKVWRVVRPSSLKSPFNSCPNPTKPSIPDHLDGLVERLATVRKRGRDANTVQKISQWPPPAGAQPTNSAASWRSQQPLRANAKRSSDAGPGLDKCDQPGRALHLAPWSAQAQATNSGAGSALRSTGRRRRAPRPVSSASIGADGRSRNGLRG